jgi:hypothetical protein
MEKEPFSPMRGDLVLFMNDVLYFQPNGSSCFLYKRRQDIGRRELAVYSPARSCIRKPTDYEMSTKVRAVPSQEAPRCAIEMLYERLMKEREENENEGEDESQDSNSQSE